MRRSFALSRRRARWLLPLLLLSVGLMTFAFVGTASADTVPFEIGKGGTNADGTCETFEGQPPAPGGTQTWQFNLTGTAGPATMSASFSDGTSVTDQAEEQPHSGNVSKWLIVTDAGASLLSATATRPESGGNPQFVVSHCTAGGEKPPPPTPPTPPGPPGGEGAAAPGAEQAPAPAAVLAPARFTG